MEEHRQLSGTASRSRAAPLVECCSAGGIAGEFNGLLRDPEVRAIIAYGGGQTVLGYFDLIDVEAITADPKPILGHSDISLLHLVLHGRAGLVGFHADLTTPGIGGHWQTVPAARQAVDAGRHPCGPGRAGADTVAARTGGTAARDDGTGRLNHALKISGRSSGVPSVGLGSDRRVGGTALWRRAWRRQGSSSLHFFTD
ncbi:LD-carboxypeptidase [Streptomyces sp. NPDC055663]